MVDSSVEAFEGAVVVAVDEGFEVVGEGAGGFGEVDVDPASSGEGVLVAAEVFGYVPTAGLVVEGSLVWGASGAGAKVLGAEELFGVTEGVEVAYRCVVASAGGVANAG